MKPIIFLMSAIFVVGCCPKVLTDIDSRLTVRVDTIRVLSPTEMKVDTVLLNNGFGENIRYIVKTDTVKAIVWRKAKTDTIYVQRIDTLRETSKTNTVFVKPTLTEKFGYASYGFIACGVFILGIILFKLKIL